MRFLEERNVHLMRAGTADWLGHEPKAGDAVYYTGDFDSFGIVVGAPDLETSYVVWSRPPTPGHRQVQAAAEEIRDEIDADILEVLRTQEDARP